VPGSSDYFLGGVISYANEAKARLLGVNWETLDTHGAVSRETVLEMACGVRQLLSADIGMSVSGIAPGGGTPEKFAYGLGSVQSLMKMPGARER
jgi:PncC family amidohydrolase